MIRSTRRIVFAGAGSSLALALAGCNTTTSPDANLKVAALKGKGKAAATPIPDAVRTAAVGASRAFAAPAAAGVPPLLGDRGLLRTE